VKGIAFTAPHGSRLSRHPWLLGACALALGGAVGFLAPREAAALLVAAAGLAWPVVALCLAIAAIPLAGEWSLPLGGQSLTLMEPAVALALAAWLVRGIRQRSLRLWPSALLAAQLLVLSLFIAASFGAEVPSLSLKETLKWLELLIVFVLTVDLTRERVAAQAVLLAILGATALEGAYGVFQFVTGQGPDFYAISPFMRAYGHFGQPNPFAGYLGTALPLAFALSTLPEPMLARGARLAAAMLALGVLASLSRGAWVGLATATAVMLAVASPRSRRGLVALTVALLLLAVLGTLGLLPAAITERLGIVAEYFGPFDVRTVEATPQNWSVVERMAHWQAAWEMFRDHPWLGIGPGNYSAAYGDYFLPGWLDPLGHAHNYYLNLAAETGALGLAAYLLTLTLAFRAAIRGLRAPAPFWRTVAVGTLGALVAIAFHSVFDNLFVHGVSVQMGALLGLAQQVSQRAGPPERGAPASGEQPASAT
jgi:putative inorganic carbon (HCO3(-)) transporter